MGKKNKRKGKPFDTTADENDEAQDTSEHNYQVSTQLLLDCSALTCRAIKNKRREFSNLFNLNLNDAV